MANNTMMEEFLARHGGKGAVSKAEREAEQKVSVTHPVTERLKSEKRYTVTREVKRYGVTRNKHCPTCSCDAIKVHGNNAARQRAYRERKG